MRKVPSALETQVTRSVVVTVTPMVAASGFLGLRVNGKTARNPVAIRSQSDAILSNPVPQMRNPPTGYKNDHTFCECLEPPSRAEIFLL